SENTMNQNTFNYRSLKECALEFIRQMIITGELKPGDVINETHLADNLNVSRPPIREAVAVLESENLVFKVPRKGIYVTDLTVEDLKEVYEMREMIECYSVKLMQQGNMGCIPEVSISIEELLSLEEPTYNDSRQKMIYHNASFRFHVELVKSCRNRLMLDCYNRIYYQLNRYQYLYYYLPGAKERAINEHKKILQLIENQFYDKAIELLSSHIEYTREVMEEKVRETRQKKINTK
ncbi:MAG: GntR family transcriptional regulator, partial [Deltaproteobacteria bacterium]|nr:GntR family transcriptional regulator [Deltaproteobacteria bacterium]